MSPELELLDRLLGGDVPLPVARDFFNEDSRIVNAISAMLSDGEIRLIGQDGADFPLYRLRELLTAPSNVVSVEITSLGAKRIG